MVTMMQSDCLICKNFYYRGTCEAFPLGIPEEIFYGKVEHREPYEGDNGIQFEPIEGQGDDDLPMEERPEPITKSQFISLYNEGRIKKIDGKWKMRK